MAAQGHLAVLAYSILALVILFQFASFYAREYRCRYCGEMFTHETDCPYNLDREERV